MEETSQQQTTELEQAMDRDAKPSSSHVNVSVNLTGATIKGLPPRHNRNASQDNGAMAGTNDYGGNINNLSVLSGDNSLSSPKVSQVPITIITTEKVKKQLSGNLGAEINNSVTTTADNLDQNQTLSNIDEPQSPSIVGSRNALNQMKGSQRNSSRTQQRALINAGLGSVHGNTAISIVANNAEDIRANTNDSIGGAAFRTSASRQASELAESPTERGLRPKFRQSPSQANQPQSEDQFQLINLTAVVNTQDSFSTGGSNKGGLIGRNLNNPSSHQARQDADRFQSSVFSQGNNLGLDSSQIKINGAQAQIDQLHSQLNNTNSVSRTSAGTATSAHGTGGVIINAGQATLVSQNGQRTQMVNSACKYHTLFQSSPSYNSVAFTESTQPIRMKLPTTTGSANSTPMQNSIINMQNQREESSKGPRGSASVAGSVNGSTTSAGNQQIKIQQFPNGISSQSVSPQKRPSMNTMSLMGSGNSTLNTSNNLISNKKGSILNQVQMPMSQQQLNTQVVNSASQNPNSIGQLLGQQVRQTSVNKTSLVGSNLSNFNVNSSQSSKKGANNSLHPFHQTAQGSSNPLFNNQSQFQQQQLQQKSNNPVSGFNNQQPTVNSAAQKQFDGSVAPGMLGKSQAQVFRQTFNQHQNSGGLGSNQMNSYRRDVSGGTKLGSGNANQKGAMGTNFRNPSGGIGNQTGATQNNNNLSNNQLAASSILSGSAMSGQQNKMPLFQMSGSQGANNNAGGNPNHLNHHPQGQINNNNVGSNPNSQANITGMSHPSTAQHGTTNNNNITNEHLNSTVGSHNKVGGDTNTVPEKHGVPSGPGNPSSWATNNNNDSNVRPLQMFERENFKFKDSIMIHVIDDSKNEKRDFTFSRSLLVKYMKYFDRCLKKISDNDEIDISIHCDAVIFEWLLNYIFAMEEYEKKQAEQEKFNRAVGNSVSNNWSLKVQKCNNDDGDKDKNSFANSAIMQYGGPKLDIKNAVTILIPAEFLKIDRLVRECLDFIGEHIEEISRVQVDMSCINTNIIREMAKKVSLDRLDVLKERKDKIVSRLFMKKLELLLEKEKNYLHKCAYCNKLFTKKQRKVLSCRKGTNFIDSNGQMRAKHVIDRNWDLKKFVTFVRETYRISWKEIYWKVWSYLHLIKCERCQDYYPIAEMGYCRQHKSSPKVKMNLLGPFGSSYEYNCCSEQVDVYQVLNGQKGDQGCQTQLHETCFIYNVPKNKEKKILDRIIAHQLIILENPTNHFIENIKLQEKNKHGVVTGTGVAVTSKEANPTSSQTPMIVRPSSLNYKISLIEAARNFIDKEKLGPDQQVEVEIEEPVSKKMQHFEVLDDALFNLQFVPKVNQGKDKSQVGKNKRDSSHRVENAWEREEEQIRKKLERSSINIMKNKIAQQNRANQEQSSTQNTDIDQQAAQGGGKDQNNPNNAQQPQSTAVQLNPTQIEEAKEMTKGKLRMYRRDRLFVSDNQRLQNLHDSLKNVRITDESSYFNSMSNDPPVKEVSRKKGGGGGGDSPPINKNVGGGGRHGGPNGGGPGGSAAGGGGGGGGGSSNFQSSGAKPGFSANQNEGSRASGAKGSEYNSRQNNGGPSGNRAAGEPLLEQPKIVTGLNSIANKRSKSTTNGALVQGKMGSANQTAKIDNFIIGSSPGINSNQISSQQNVKVSSFGNKTIYNNNQSQNANTAESLKGKSPRMNRLRGVSSPTKETNQYGQLVQPSSFQMNDLQQAKKQQHQTYGSQSNAPNPFSNINLNVDANQHQAAKKLIGQSPVKLLGQLPVQQSDEYNSNTVSSKLQGNFNRPIGGVTTTAQLRATAGQFPSIM